MHIGWFEQSILLGLRPKAWRTFIRTAKPLFRNHDAGEYQTRILFNWVDTAYVPRSVLGVSDNNHHWWKNPYFCCNAMKVANAKIVSCNHHPDGIWNCNLGHSHDAESFLCLYDNHLIDPCLHVGSTCLF